jgi:hypothetical protein
MEAELVRELPPGDGWQYEPKWDGFRGVLENDGGELALWSPTPGRPSCPGSTSGRSAALGAEPLGHEAAFLKRR